MEHQAAKRGGNPQRHVDVKKSVSPAVASNWKVAAHGWLSDIKNRGLVPGSVETILYRREPVDFKAGLNSFYRTKHHDFQK